MDNREARSVLSLHREGEAMADEARMKEALRMAAADPSLARWQADDQELDRIIASKLKASAVPAGLKSRILAGTNAPPRERRLAWPRAITLAAAACILAAIITFWRAPSRPVEMLADYRAEMVSFVRVPPSLELLSEQIVKIDNFLAKENAPANFAIPKTLASYEPLGCRVLRFRGHDVSLVCFKIGDDNLAHLFVTDSQGLSANASPAAPSFVAEGEWMTASWKEGDRVYLLAVKGDRAAAEKFLGTI